MNYQQIIVTLAHDQLEEAATAGVMRRVSALQNTRTIDREARTTGKAYWEMDVTAAIAEYAVCLVYGFPFTGCQPSGIRRLTDAGPLEVRTVGRAEYGLVAYPKDVDHQILVLTQVHDRRVVLKGWATAGEVRQWGTIVKAYANVPQLSPEELHPMSTIGHTPIPSSAWRPSGR